ncbi:hypothetical protein AB0N05_21350 [Nocardia sp. NPDC051030]|uniref:hypothetical protein n=1 Tax=Nocardia sp. NPDC051030 TaxID=3155162 RepID=UPI003428D25A
MLDGWRDKLRFIVVVVFGGLCFLIPAYYDKVDTYLAGERVTAQVLQCELAGRKAGTNYTCLGSWVRNGVADVGTLHGVSDSEPPGTTVAVRVTDDAAVLDSPRWMVYFAIGCLALVTVTGLIVRLFVRLIRATRPR